MNDVRCGFYVRQPRENGQWRYKILSLPGYHGDGKLRTACPPVVGDLISLYESGFGKRDGALGGLYRVLARSWLNSSYGSADWPYGRIEPQSGPLLDIIVEPAEGMFENEAPLSEAEEAEYE